ncbi:DNA replication domain protein [Pectobacterium zantedeschiae]|uniref:DNA replication domain protein n=1 Tax=Pectobacterium zantedeschiae TaxID=2034769 RepID=UPI0032EC1537
MAGDWIKMRADLHTHPKVVRMASALKADRLRIVGGLHSAWCLFDVHSVDGLLEGYNSETLDDLIGFPGFSKAMISIGWLEEDGESLVMPRFDAHNGQSAKRRAQDAERKRNIRKTSASDADKARTREEKRREDINKDPPLTPPKQKKAFPYPDNLNVDAWEEWKRYRKDLKLKAYAPTSRSEGAAITNLINLSGGDLQRQAEIIKQSMANCWQGLFELKSGSNHEASGAVGKGVNYKGRAVEAVHAATAEFRRKHGIPEERRSCGEVMGSDGGNLFRQVDEPEWGGATVDLDKHDWKAV